jgi:hypothetical protein
MSLDVYLKKKILSATYSANVTHNLNKMAEAAGVYEAVWRPDEIGIKYASELAPFLEDGIEELKSAPLFYKNFNPKNGWGSYDQFVGWLERYLEACKENPDALVEVWR